MLEPIEPFIAERHLDKLRGLAKMLREKHLWAMAAPPYPVSHGEAHIAGVVANIAKLLKAIGPARLVVRSPESTEDSLFQLAAAALVHDIAMGIVASQTKPGPNAARRDHPNWDILRDYFKQYGVVAFMSDEDLYRTLIIAWAHAGDLEYTAAEKAQWVDVHFQNRAGAELVPLCMRLLRFADLCDLGPHRLNPVVDTVDWDAGQIAHRDKHRLVKIVLADHWVEMQWARPTPSAQATIPKEARLQLVGLRDEIKKQLGELTGWLVGWRLVDDVGLDDLPPEDRSGEADNGPAAPEEPKRPEVSVPPVPIGPYFGRENDLSRLGQLLGMGGEVRRRIIGIHGKAGMGKSTFLVHGAWAQALRSAFPDGMFWTALGQKPLGLNKTLSEWSRVCGLDYTGRVADEMLAALANHLLGRRILLLVDDVWQSHDMGVFLRLCHPTVSLVFTTRIPAIAIEAAPHAGVFELPLLDEAASVQLLRCWAPAVVDRHEDACRKLAHDLEYLPLALNVAGNMLAKCHCRGILQVERLMAELQNGAAVLAQKPPASMLPFIEEADKNTTVAALVGRSIEVLSKPARQCFCSLGVMAPKPATFNLRMVKSICDFLDDPLPALRELVDNGLVEAMGNQRFQMHAMLLAYAKYRLQEGKDLDAL